MSNSEAFQMGYNLRRIIDNPNYYEGEWFVTIFNRKKICSNYSTASAWANYLLRKYGSWSKTNLSIGKVL